MNSKKAGILYLITVITMIAGSFIFYKVSSFFGNNLVANLIFSQGVVLVPAIGMVVAYEYKPVELLSVGPFDFLLAMCAILYTLALAPMMVEANILSQLVVTNEAVEMMGDITDIPMWMMVLIVGILGPVSEEIIFRGVFYGSFRRSGNLKGAIVLQALLFGLCHGNLNQFAYAFIMGIAMAVIVEASGTIFSSIFMHALINTSSVLFSYSMLSVLDESEYAAATASKPSILYMLAAAAVVLPFAVVGYLVARLIVGFVAVICGNVEMLNGKLPGFSKVKINFKFTDADLDDDEFEDFESIVDAKADKPASEDEQNKTPLMSVFLIVGMVIQVILLAADTVMQVLMVK